MSVLPSTTVYMGQPFHVLFHCSRFASTHVHAEAEASVKELTSATSAVIVQSTLDQIVERSQQLQKDLADNSHLLTKYNLKSAQQVSGSE